MNLMKTISNDDKYVSLKVKGLMFGLSVQFVQDVIYTPEMTAVPLSPNTLCGLLNLRGRIVTAIDLGIILDLGASYFSSDKNNAGHNTMSIIIEMNNELFSFIVDSVGEVITIDPHFLEKKPANLDERWRQYTTGVFRHEDELLVVLDEKKIFADLMCANS